MFSSSFHHVIINPFHVSSSSYRHHHAIAIPSSSASFWWCAAATILSILTGWDGMNYRGHRFIATIYFHYFHHQIDSMNYWNYHWSATTVTFRHRQVSSVESAACFISFSPFSCHYYYLFFISLLFDDLRYAIHRHRLSSCHVAIYAIWWPRRATFSLPPAAFAITLLRRGAPRRCRHAAPRRALSLPPPPCRWRWCCRAAASFIYWCCRWCARCRCAAATMMLLMMMPLLMTPTIDDADEDTMIMMMPCAITPFSHPGIF